MLLSYILHSHIYPLMLIDDDVHLHSTYIYFLRTPDFALLLFSLTSAFPSPLLSSYLCFPLTSASLCFHQEIGRLQKLPGYPRLKKQLIVNLMTAPPDITHKNIRVYVYLILYQFIYVSTLPLISTIIYLMLMCPVFAHIICVYSYFLFTHNL